MVLLSTLLVHLKAYDGLLESCSFKQLDLFIRLCRHFRPEINLYASITISEPPHRLPEYLNIFLADVLSINGILIIDLWNALKGYVWSYTEDYGLAHLSDDEISLVNCVGSRTVQKKEKLAAVMFYPPTTQCHLCERQLKLSSLTRHAVVYFSATGGLDACMGYSTSLACTDCGVRYQPNYYIYRGFRNFYNAHVPGAIQIENQAYVESELCELYTSFMLFAWVSQQNCSNIHNASVKRRDNTKNELTISSEQVFRAFAMNALLRDAADTGCALILPHCGDHDERLRQAMERRNTKMIIEGQNERMHACNRCEKLQPGTGFDGKRSFRAVVMDGISIGRPCCKVHNCTKPLPTNRAHFCTSHEAENKICVVNECGRLASDGLQTCADQLHRDLETKRKEKGKAFFQLQQRLRSHNSSHLPNSMEENDPRLLEDFEDDNSYDTNVKKSDAGNRVPKARFARRRTHNEQLIVATCGIITARGTMYGAESISGAKDFLKSVYPTPEDVPDVVFYDNNCSLQAHLNRQNDQYFENIIMPVDVFHFKSKHKITDEFCQKHCNPARWKSLSDSEGNWIFNSSAAEQVNAWMGGYLSMVRDMLAYRYEFFLDEMIKRRNEKLIEKLDAANENTYTVPSLIHSTM